MLVTNANIGDRVLDKVYWCQQNHGDHNRLISRQRWNHVTILFCR